MAPIFFARGVNECCQPLFAEPLGRRTAFKILNSARRSELRWQRGGPARQVFPELYPLPRVGEHSASALDPCSTSLCWPMASKPS